MPPDLGDEKMVVVEKAGDVRYSARYLEQKPNGDIIRMVKAVSFGSYKDDDKVYPGTVTDDAQTGYTGLLELMRMGSGW